MGSNEIAGVNQAFQEGEQNKICIQQYPQEVIELATKKLYALGFSKANNIIFNHGQERGNFSESFAGQSIKRANINAANITSNFQSAAVTGSKFTNCHFIKSANLNDANFEFCDFIDCFFILGNGLNSISFNGSYFIETTFQNTDIMHTTFTNVIFENCTFENLKIESTTFENSTFINCTFNHVDLSELNMDFVDFESIKQMNEVVLPLSQISYMFGCLDYLLTTNDRIYINSKDKNICIADILQDLLCYYTNSREFFPMANILIAQKRFEQAREVIVYGIRSLVQAESIDFRMFKYLCKLASKYSLLRKIEKDYLNAGIISIFEDKTLSRYRSKLNSHLGEIQTYLSKENGSAIVSLETNLANVNPQRIASIIEITNLIEDLFGCNIAIKVTHNSSPIIDLIISAGQSFLLVAGVKYYLSKVAGAIYKLFTSLFSFKKKKVAKKDAEMQKENELKEEKNEMQKIQEICEELEQTKRDLMKKDKELEYLHIENESLKENLKEKEKKIEELYKKLEQAYKMVIKVQSHTISGNPSRTQIGA